MKKIIALFCLCCTLIKVNAQIISTYAGNGSYGYSGDGGAATAAKFSQPLDVAIDGGNNIYVCDYNNHRIRKITPAGVISTFAGTGSSGFSGDGGAATAAQITEASCIVIDGGGNLFFNDINNYRIRKITPSGIISTIAGNGSSGGFGSYTSVVATSASIGSPQSLAVDGSGNLYICPNNIVKITASGTMVSIAGRSSVGYGYSGDGGPASAAMLSGICGVAVYGGDIYIADAGNNCIRKINTSGVITTIAGTGSAGYSGDGGAASNAQMRYPHHIKIDGSGNIFVSETNNHIIRKIAPSMIISTVAGNGTAGYSGDNAMATAAKLNFPNGIELSSGGDIFICDATNNRVRKVSSHVNHPPSFPSSSTQYISVCASSAGVPLDEQMKVRDADAGQALTIALTAAPAHGTANVAYTATSNAGVVSPSGSYYRPAAGYSGSDSFTVSVSDGTATATTVVRVTINGAPAAPVISGATSLCFHGTTTLSATPTGGTWLAYDGNASVSSGGVVTSTGGGASHIGYLSPADAHGCKSVAVYTVTPIGTPSAGSLTGTNTVCPGSSVTFTPSVAGGTWSSNNTSVATVAGGGSITGVVTGNAVITYTVNNGCFSASTNKSITVTGATNPGPIGGMPNINMPYSVTFVNSLAGGTWSSTNTSVATITSGGVISGVAAGVDTIIYTYTNGCGISASVMKRITVLSHRDNINNEQGATVNEGSVQLTIYPNPTKGFVTLVLAGATGKTDVVVCDLTGKVINAGISETAKMVLDFNNLSAGIYLVKVCNGGNVYMEKVIVK